MIKVKGLVKKYKSGTLELAVLKGLDLEVKKGEFLSITGRSGSGKSTLLYQLGLLDEPNAGEIIINDQDISKLDSTERSRFRLNELGYIFQDYALVPELTAFENVFVPLLMQGLEKKDAENQAVNAMQKVGLSEKLKNLPSQLSGGEQQRVSIARAIGHNPKILFADEPTANLDSETAETVLKTFLDLHREGQTIVMVTHEPEYAALTDRIVLLLDGTIGSDKRNH
ncbi:MAG: putative ABC transport system ATP-binding protein [Parcubacteria group bacterium Gr01-1014_20]|nr:MAG: putative ABC transport system ATP-binding protein [Parcubacteria group bacterium Gr01-1014_20]